MGELVPVELPMFFPIGRKTPGSLDSLDLLAIDFGQGIDWLLFTTQDAAMEFARKHGFKNVYKADDPQEFYANCEYAKSLGVVGVAINPLNVDQPSFGDVRLLLSELMTSLKGGELN